MSNVRRTVEQLLSSPEHRSRIVAVELMGKNPHIFDPVDLKSDVAGDPEQVERFRQEARVTAMLAHPHIVVVLDREVEDGAPWIAYLEPGDKQARERLDLLQGTR